MANGELTWKDKFQNQKKLNKKLREESTGAIETAARTGLTMGGAFGLAWWESRFPENKEVVGAPLSLVAGGALTVAAYMGWAGAQSSNVEALANGMLSVFAVQKGAEIGAEQLAASP